MELAEGERKALAVAANQKLVSDDAFFSIVNHVIGVILGNEDKNALLGIILSI